MGKLLKTFGIYFLGNVVSRLMSFVVMPVISHNIDPKAYGYYEMANGMINIIITLVSVQAWAAILRYLFEYEDKRHKRKVIATGYSIEILTFLFFTAGFCILNVFVDIRDAGYIYFCAASYMLFQNISFTVRGLGYNKLYVVSGIIGSVVSLASNLILVLVFHWGSDALMLSMALSYFVPAVFMELCIRSFKKFRVADIDLKLMKIMLVYCIPVSLNQGAYWINTQANKVLITMKLGQAENGVYSMSFRLTAMILFIVTMFNLAWQEYTFSISKDADRSKKYNVVLNNFIRFICCGLLILIPITNIFFPFLIGEKYSAGRIIIPLAYLGTFLDSLANFIGSIMCAEKRMKSMFYSTIVGSVITIGFMLLTLNTLGLQSATIAMILCFLAVIIIRTISIRTIVKLKYNFKFFVHYLIMFALASYVFFNFGWGANIISTVVIGIYSLIVLRDIIKDFFNMAKNKMTKT